MSKLISIGEALIDFIPSEKNVGLKNTKSFSPVVGGAPLNVAVAVGKLGGESVFLSKVGKDSFGDKIIDVLKQFNVESKYIRRTSKANTGLAFVSLNEEGNREFSFYRNPSADMLLEDSEIEDIFNKDDILHFCSVSLIEAPIKKAHLKAIEYAKEKGTIISFDPNVRLPLWKSKQECRETILEFIPKADIIKISDEELEFITGIKDEDEALKSLFVGSIKVILYTKGKNGVEFITKNRKIAKRGFSVEAVDTTGAGDAFIGAFIYVLLRYKYNIASLEALNDGRIEEILNFSNAVGALTVRKKGGTEAIPKLMDVEKFLKEKMEDTRYRSKYHIMPPVGWINDPVGLSYYQGNYNIYYEYSPFDKFGGIKYWGHYRGENIFKGEHLGIAIEPTIEADIDGVYSGSVLVENNLIYAIYTGNVKYKGNHDYVETGREQNVIVATSKDGIKFTDKRVVLTNKDYPKNLSLHVRDPKVWKSNNDYFMILGARDKNGVGEILLYSSQDMYNWRFISSLLDNHKELGYMFECPDLFRLDNKDVLIFSPQGIESKDKLYNNKYQSGYLLGRFSKESMKFIESEKFIELDRGFDFYAPQTFLDNKERRILIGWMGVSEEDSYSNPTVKEGWNHQLTLPRELKIIEEKIYQLPLKEIESLRKNHKEINNLIIEKRKKLELLESEEFELDIDFKEINSSVNINIRGAEIEYNRTAKVFNLNLEKVDIGRKNRACRIEKLKNIRIFSDTSSLEIFINDGEEVFTTRLFNDEKKLDLIINGNLSMNLNYWKY
ncbi:MAG: sucrose-6-phosphate hydrolase [Clostridium sp.]